MAGRNLLPDNASSTAAGLYPSAGGYLYRDGLPCCPKCEQPLVLPVPAIIRNRTTMKFLKVLCKCGQEALQQTEASTPVSNESSARQLFPALPRRFRDCSFENSEPDEALRQVQSYANDWRRKSSAGQNLLLWGAPGTGKTHAAACLVNALIHQGCTATMTGIRELKRNLATQAYSDSAACMGAYIQADLLILEDLGVGDSTDYELGLLYDLIDGRYREQRPIVITTSLSPDQLRRINDLRLKQLLSRLLQTCTSVRFSCRNYREQQHTKEE